MRGAVPVICRAGSAPHGVAHKLTGHGLGSTGRDRVLLRIEPRPAFYTRAA